MEFINSFGKRLLCLLSESSINLWLFLNHVQNLSENNSYI